MSLASLSTDLSLLEADCKGDENIVDRILKRSQELERLLNVKCPINDSSNPEFFCRKWICIEIALREQNILYNRNRVLNILGRVPLSQYRKMLVCSKQKLKLPPPSVEVVKKLISMKYTHQYLDAAIALVDKWRNSESSNSFNSSINTTVELCASFQTIATAHKLKVEKGSLIDMGELHPETFDALLKSFQDMESYGSKNSADNETKVSELRTPDSADYPKLMIKPANVRSYFGMKAAASSVRTVVPASSSSAAILKSPIALSASSSSMQTASSISKKCLTSTATVATTIDRCLEKYQQADADGLSSIGDCQILPSAINRKRKSDSEVSSLSSSSSSVVGRGPALTNKSTIPATSEPVSSSTSSSSSASMVAKSVAATTATASSELDADMLRERFRYAAYRKWKQEVVAAKKGALGTDSGSCTSNDSQTVVGDS